MVIKLSTANRISISDAYGFNRTYAMLAKIYQPTFSGIIRASRIPARRVYTSNERYWWYLYHSRRNNGNVHR